MTTKAHSRTKLVTHAGKRKFTTTTTTSTSTSTSKQLNPYNTIQPSITSTPASTKTSKSTTSNNSKRIIIDDDDDDDDDMDDDVQDADTFDEEDVESLDEKKRNKKRKKPSMKTARPTHEPKTSTSTSTSPTTPTKKSAADADPWTYYPAYIRDEKTFDHLFREIERLVSRYMIRVPFKTQLYPSKRKSAIFMNDEMIPKWKDGTKKVSEGASKKQQALYQAVPSFSWNQSSELKKIRDRLQSEFRITFGYALIHLYHDGNDNINYHADSEGSRSRIFSLSLGATRKFRFRKQGQTQGYYKQYEVKNGDLILMEPQCQQQFVHGVPTEKTVKQPRINVTFRCFQ